MASLRATRRLRCERTMPRLPCGQGRGNPVIGPESLRCRCSIASGEVNARLESSLSPFTVLADQSFFSRCCGSFLVVVRTPVWRRYHSCGVVPVCGSTLRGTTVGFRNLAMVGGFLCSKGQDSQYEVGVNGTMRVQSVFHGVAEEANFEISPALSLLPTSSTMPQLGPRFLPLEPAVSSEGSIKCSDVVSDAFLSSAIVRWNPPQLRSTAVFVASVRIVPHSRCLLCSAHVELTLVQLASLLEHISIVCTGTYPTGV